MLRSLINWSSFYRCLFYAFGMKVVHLNKQFVLVNIIGTRLYKLYYLNVWGIPHTFSECMKEDHAEFKWRVLMNQEA